MRTFIAPLDFSAAAAVVFQNACSLAVRLNGAIKLIGVCPKPIPYGREASEIAKVTQRAYQATERRLKDFIEQEDVRSAGRRPLAYQTFFGPVSEAIVEASNEENVEMIVLGANDFQDIESQWKGSVFYNVAKHASRSVFISPVNDRFHDVQNILLVCEMESLDFMESEIKELTTIAYSFGASIRIVCVEKTDETDDTNALKKARQIFAAHNVNVEISVETLLREKTAATVLAYARKKDFDLLAVAARGSSFWESIFEEKMVKVLVSELNIPFIALRHENAVSVRYDSTLQFDFGRLENNYN